LRRGKGHPHATSHDSTPSGPQWCSRGACSCTGYGDAAYSHGGLLPFAAAADPGTHPFADSSAHAEPDPGPDQVPHDGGADDIPNGCPDSTAVHGTHRGPDGCAHT